MLDPPAKLLLVVSVEGYGPQLEKRPAVDVAMIKFILWCILLVLCWPLALLALMMYPIVWLLLLPFRLLGIAVEGVLAIVWSIVMLPARILRGVVRSQNN